MNSVAQEQYLCVRVTRFSKVSNTDFSKVSNTDFSKVSNTDFQKQFTSVAVDCSFVSACLFKHYHLLTFQPQSQRFERIVFVDNHCHQIYISKSFSLNIYVFQNLCHHQMSFRDFGVRGRGPVYVIFTIPAQYL